MNELTRQVVIRVAKANKALAKKNDISFDFKVRDEHWETLLAKYGWIMKERSLHIWRLFHPEHFDKDGDAYYIQDYKGKIFDIDMELSRIVCRVLKRKIARNPELQLDDWGDLPVQTVDPQLKLF